MSFRPFKRFPEAPAPIKFPCHLCPEVATQTTSCAVHGVVRVCARHERDATRCVCYKITCTTFSTCYACPVALCGVCSGLCPGCPDKVFCPTHSSICAGGCGKTFCTLPRHRMYSSDKDKTVHHCAKFWNGWNTLDWSFVSAAERDFDVLLLKFYTPPTLLQRGEERAAIERDSLAWRARYGEHIETEARVKSLLKDMGGEGEFALAVMRGLLSPLRPAVIRRASYAKRAPISPPRGVAVTTAVVRRIDEPDVQRE